MRLLFVSGAGIHPEQRINRWKMVSKLYAQMGNAMRALGHQCYFYVHPDAFDETLPLAKTWLCPDHEHFAYVLDTFQPDFVFCWNGSSPGDVITASMAAAYGAKMIFSEQGWFPQSKTLYFDMTGTNARCSTRHRVYPDLSQKERSAFLQMRAKYIVDSGIDHLFDTAEFSVEKVDFSKPIFVPLQDERDLNIVQDAPFKRMDDFVAFLTQAFPQATLRVRPHPKYPNPYLSSYPNVEMDSPKKPMFESLAECGLVVGINSTTLLESALLGKAVVSVGESLATGSGLFYDYRPDNDRTLPEVLQKQLSDATAESVLFTLLKKQLPRESLAAPLQMLTSSVFNEMRTLAELKPLQAWI